LSTKIDIALVSLLLVAGTSDCARGRQPAERRARQIHERLLTLDTHLDTPANFATPGWDILERHEYREDFSQVDYPRMVSGGLDGGVWAIYTPQGPRTTEAETNARDLGLQAALRIRELAARDHDQFELALRADDAARGKRIRPRSGAAT
jgi:membrane dipeptidase